MTPLEIGVCGWSLGLTGDDAIVETIRSELGLNVCQWGYDADHDIDPASSERTLSRLKESGIKISLAFVGFPGEDYSTISSCRQTVGFVDPERLNERLAKVIRVRDFVADLGVDKIGVHVGFLPHDSSDQTRTRMVDAVRRVADALADTQATLCMETGQEPADLLLGFLNDVNRSNVKINMDPANMLLYGSGDPIQAVETLRDHIVSCHCKDAIASGAPGEEWGEETPLGDGDVNVARFVSKLKAIGYEGPLIVECEEGDDRIGDIRYGVEYLESMLG